MTKAQFAAFCGFREEFRSYCGAISEEFGAALRPLQAAAAGADTPPYPVENPVVYNAALDEVGEGSDVRLVVVGDNPGKDEQLARNRRYLVGQSGKIAANFFARNPSFGVDFRANAVILNKTPVHTAKTKHLRELSRADAGIARLVEESQVWLARKTAALHRALCADGNVELWLVGYGEMKGRGLFLPYRDALKASSSAESWRLVRVFRHFSMNCFLVDLRSFMAGNPGLPVEEAASRLGRLRRDEIFGAFG